MTGDLYRRMLTIRLVEDRLQQLCDRGEAGDLHFSRGQEAISVGVCAVLRPTDYMVTHHRTIAHEIAKGADLYPLLAEILGKATGVCGGKAGEMHIRNPAIRHAFSFQLVGTCVPVAAGLAWALKNVHNTDDIVVCFLGDAAFANGQVHEGLTIASVRECPVLFVCENNGRAGNVTPEYYSPVQHPAHRATSYAMEARVANGSSVKNVFEVAQVVSNIVREEREPMLLEVVTERLCHHKQGQGDLRSKAEIAELAKLSDPLRYFERGDLEAEIHREIDAVLERVAGDPLPEWT